MGKKGLIWWEKTVEYAFVLQHLSGATALPFAGKPEQAWGDLLVRGALNDVCLVEFKRTKGSINSEFDKYPDFLVDDGTESGKKNVRSDLLTKDFREAYLDLLREGATDLTDEQYQRVAAFSETGHQFVYGVTDGLSFLLRATPYAGVQDDTKVPADPAREWGCDLQTVAEYLRVLAQLRNCWDEENGVSGSAAMGMVMGMSVDGPVVIPASDLLRLAVDYQLIPAPVHTSDPTSEPSYPAPGF